MRQAVITWREYKSEVRLCCTDRSLWAVAEALYSLALFKSARQRQRRAAICAACAPATEIRRVA